MVNIKRVFAKYLGALLLFGSNGVVAKHIALSSQEIVLLRTLLGSLFLITVFFVGRGKLHFYRHGAQIAFLCGSGMAMGASWLFLYEAYVRIGVGMASLLYYCGPVFVMVLSPLLFRERLTRRKIAGFLLVLCGICMVNGMASGKQDTGNGALFGLFAAVMYALMVMLNKKAVDITGLENAMLQLFVSFLTVALAVGLQQGFAVRIEAPSVLPIFVLGFLNTGFGCYLYFSSIGNLPIQTVAVCGYLEPLSAVLFATLLLGETMLPLQILGAGMIIGGAVIAETV